MQLPRTGTHRHTEEPDIDAAGATSTAEDRLSPLRRKDRHAGDSCLAVANYAPDIGFAWWLMENFWLQLQEMARSHGMRTLVAYPTHGQIPEHIAQAELDILFHPFPGRSAADKWRSLQLVRRRRIKVIYLTDRAYTAWFYLPLRLLGVRCIVNHDHTPGDRPRVTGLRGMLKSLVARLPWVNCDLQFVVSPLMQTRATENAHLPRDRVVVVQNGIPAAPLSGDRTYAHRLLNLPSTAQVCISAGRVTEYKRVGFILDIARRIKDDPSLDAVIFVHCGDGPDLDMLRARVECEGLNGRVRLLGRRSDVAQLMQSASLALHPSRGEAFSLAIVEYMRAGVRVVVPDIASVCQAIEPAVTGLVYRDGDVDDAACAIGTLARNRELAAELGRNGTERAHVKYSIDQTNRQFREALRAAFERMN